MVREILEILYNFIKSRMFIAFLILLCLFSIVIYRVFYLQIVNTDNYVNKYTQKMEKTRYYNSTRGNIYDSEGNVLAYNKSIYSVSIEDTLDSSVFKSSQMNEIIFKTIQIIEKYGDSLISDFPIEYANDTFTWSSSISERTRIRFLKDIFGTETLDTEKEKLSESTPKDVFDFMISSKKYEIDTKKYDNLSALKIAMIRYNLSLNAYQKYISTTIAKDISENTVAAIYESSDVIPGVKINEDTQRIYNDSLYYSHIIGYTGKISEEQLTSLNGNISNKNEYYHLNDIVGKTGIESSMELTLSGRKGYDKVIVDSLGKVKSVIEEKKATPGNDIYLTINSKLQKGIYHLIEEDLASILVDKIVNRNLSVSDKEDWLIPIKDVYYQIINNNVVDQSKFLDADSTDNEKIVGNALSNRKAEVLAFIDGELNNSSAKPLNTQNPENNEYLTYIFNMLSDESYNINLIPKTLIDAEDSTYKKWMKDEISLRDMILYSIDKNWVDTSILNIEKNYVDRETIYSSIIIYLKDILAKDTKFDKLIYKYLIENGTISGSLVCKLLYDQGVLPFDANAYNSLSKGSISSFDFIMSQIKALKITPAMLALEPCSASVTLVEPNTGNVIAMVSYPSYDNNAFSGSIDYNSWKSLSDDLSSPLYSRATKMRTAPGSTFKVLSSISGLEEGVISIGETISCKGIYDTITPSPKCWIYPGAHGSLSVAHAIEHSCNYFFCEVGYRLGKKDTGTYSSEKGLSYLKKYGAMVGLTEKSGVEVEEYAPLFSTENAVTSAFGQGSHSFTGVQLARYSNTIASNGTNYELTLLKKITDYNNKEQPLPTKKVEKMDVSASSISTVQQGMKLAAGTYGDLKGMGITVAAKTGTAQESANSPDHALIISYAPFDKPTVSLSVMIQNGYSSAYASKLTRDVYDFYFEKTTLEQILAGTSDGPAKLTPVTP